MVKTKGVKMLLSDREKSAKLSVLDELQKKIDDFGASRIKKSGSPKSGLLAAMDEAGHEGVEAAEEKLFPEDEAAEHEAMESGGPSEEEKAMIAQLFQKYCS